MSSATATTGPCSTATPTPAMSPPPARYSSTTPGTRLETTISLPAPPISILAPPCSLLRSTSLAASVPWASLSTSAPMSSVTPPASGPSSTDQPQHPKQGELTRPVFFASRTIITHIPRGEHHATMEYSLLLLSNRIRGYRRFLKGSTHMLLYRWDPLICHCAKEE